MSDDKLVRSWIKWGVGSNKVNRFIEAVMEGISAARKGHNEEDDPSTAMTLDTAGRFMRGLCQVLDKNIEEIGFVENKNGYSKTVYIDETLQGMDSIVGDTAHAAKTFKGKREESKYIAEYGPSLWNDFNLTTEDIDIEEIEVEREDEEKSTKHGQRITKTVRVPIVRFNNWRLPYMMHLLEGVRASKTVPGLLKACYQKAIEENASTPEEVSSFIKEQIADGTPVFILGAVADAIEKGWGPEELKFRKGSLEERYVRVCYTLLTGMETAHASERFKRTLQTYQLFYEQEDKEEPKDEESEISSQERERREDAKAAGLMSQNRRLKRAMSENVIAAADEYSSNQKDKDVETYVDPTASKTSTGKCNVVIISNPHPDPHNLVFKNQYEMDEASFELIRYLSENLQILSNEKKTKASGKPFGKLDERRIWKAKTYREYGIQPIYFRWKKRRNDVAVAILVDESGSMLYGRKSYAAAVIGNSLLTVLDNKMGVTAKLYGHCADVTSSGYGLPYSVYEMDNETENTTIVSHYPMGEAWKLTGRGAWNKDGIAMRYVLSQLMRSNAKRKLFILVADGIPNGHCYSGIEDTTAAGMEILNQGFTSAFIGVCMDRSSLEWAQRCFSSVQDVARERGSSQDWNEIAIGICNIITEAVVKEAYDIGV